MDLSQSIYLQGHLLHQQDQLIQQLQRVPEEKDEQNGNLIFIYHKSVLSITAPRLLPYYQENSMFIFKSEIHPEIVNVYVSGLDTYGLATVSRSASRTRWSHGSRSTSRSNMARRSRLSTVTLSV